MKFLLYFLMIFGSINSSAQQLKPLKPILENALNANDKPMLAYSLKRCVYLNFLMGAWMKEKGGSGTTMQEAIKNYFEQAENLKNLAFQLDRKIEEDRGIKVSTVDEWLKNNQQLQINITKLYVDKLGANMAASGSYFANDAELKNDIDICRNFMGYISR
jgi:hypothetical protein